MLIKTITDILTATATATATAPIVLQVLSQLLLLLLLLLLLFLVTVLVDLSCYSDGSRVCASQFLFPLRVPVWWAADCRCQSSALSAAFHSTRWSIRPGF